MDLVYLIVGGGFFLLCAGFVVLTRKLMVA